VVVFGPSTQDDSDPVGIRVRNVTSTGFEWQFDEWDYQDGVHAEEKVHYLVAEEGSYIIGGLLWQFGRAAAVNHAASALTFAEAFAVAPVVLTQTASRNGASAVKSRVSGVSATGFSVRLEEENAQDQTHVNETVHYLAVQQGNGRLLTPPYLSVNTFLTAAEVTGFFKSQAFTRKVADPFLFADAQTRNDIDPITLRFRNLDANGAELRLQEERGRACFFPGHPQRRHGTGDCWFRPRWHRNKWRLRREGRPRRDAQRHRVLRGRGDDEDGVHCPGP